MTTATLPKPAHARLRAGGTLAGTGTLVRTWLRRDRIMIPVWVYALLAYLAATAKGFKDLYTTEASRQSFATSINGNGATRALYGVVQNWHSVGGLVGWRVGIVGSALVAVMNILLVTRHTRAEEETGRLELVGSAVVGRHAMLTAGLVVALVADAALALLSVLTLIAFGMPAAGSIAIGLGWATVGLVFAGVAGITAQLTESSRSANGLAFAVLGLAFLERAMADAASGNSLNWISPVAWSGAVHPYAGERWAVLLLPLALTAVLLPVGYRINSTRDFGAGLLPARPGPANAPASLRSPLALAWRLQRGVLLGWCAGLAVFGLAIGSIAKGVGDLIKGSSGSTTYITKLGGQHGLVDAFLATTMGMMALFASAYAIQSVLRLRAEESAARAEVLLATPVTRLRWALSHLVISVAGSAVLLTVVGLCAGILHGIRMGDLGGQLPRVLGAALAQLPAVWVVAAITVALFGLVPQATAAAWGVLGAFVLIGQLGPVLKFPQWVVDLAPFTHVPKLPGGAFSATPLLWLTFVGLAFGAAGLAGLRRRDLG